ncbi:hypothetical protein [Bacillus sp. m3-13]|uniref:hypothetical protein n=1 Tax=Bacillus sp. m3-13 TaxID=406124 RepID=UPI0001E8910A|nr:hypothetical protein [Bacillus sp. m3-13]
MLKFISTFMLVAIIGVIGYHFYDYVDGGSLFSSTTLASVQEIEHQEFEDAVLYQENREVSTLEVLAEQHKYLNDVTGWGGADTVDLRNLKNI